MNKNLDIYTDASYRQTTHDGSYGYIILLDGLICHQFCKSTKNIKSNCVEFMGIKYGLKNALKFYLKKFLTLEHVTVYTDSQNCIDYINNEKKLHDETLKEIKKDVDKIIKEIHDHYPVTLNFEHVKGHVKNNMTKKNKLNNIIDKTCTMISEYNKNVNLEV